MVNPYSLWAIPGFLGLPSDWSDLGLDHLKGIDLFSFPWSDFSEWAQQLNARVSKENEPAILMGYSLGGRLALHALIQNPTRWAAGVIISAHPGLGDPALKQQRLAHDEKWAQRFEKEPWKEVIKQWNQQDVFLQDAVHFHRKEEDYERQRLADLLRKASLGRQDDLRALIQALPIPLLWIVGEKDPRYCALAQSLTFKHPQSVCLVIPDAGHRTPWAQPETFKMVVQAFMQTVGVEKKKKAKESNSLAFQ
ncbi:alpha/beta fold hydrolase [Candidatus Protochlamydia phocaeensis]|uniref:alpha/beta fold hydrolase n=1 Tax=Candidatus Protochlamydia phocaeensis TaxID=1414722 RepID=UPI0008383135|nr:alpha/beta fold hydrolase [Candidatus Protochlamydia phocaeensis]